MERRQQLILFLIVSSGVLLRVWNIGWDLPEIYEEAYPFKTAWNFWNWDGAGFDFNPHIFNYAAFTFYVHFFLQALHFIMGWLFGLYPNLQAFHQSFETDPTPFIVVARLSSVLFDAATIITAYLLGKKIFDKVTALLSAAFISLNILHIKESHLINVDTPLTFFTLLSIYYIYQVYDSGGRKWYLLSGLAIGLAVATKYTGALLLPLLIAAHLIRTDSPSKGLKSQARTDLLSSIGITVLVFIVLNPFIILSYEEFYQRFSFVYYNVITHGHLGIPDSESSAGFYLFRSIPSHIGLALTAAVIGAVLYIIRRWQKREILLLFFPFVYLVVIAQWKYRADRYLLPVLPLLILLGSFGLFAFSKWINKRIIRLFLQKTGRGGFSDNRILIGLTAVVAFPLVLEFQKYQSSYNYPDTRTVTKEWILKNVPPGASIASTESGLRLPENRYRIIQIPYHPAMQSVLAGFYRTEWYSDLDLIIGSSFDYGRYLLDPGKYGEFIRFYNTLHTQSVEVKEFQPQNNQNGPTIWLYRPDVAARDTFPQELFKELDILAETSLVVNFLENLAFSVYLKGNLVKSAQLMQHALLLDPVNLRILREFAWNLFKLGMFREGLEVVDRSLTLNRSQEEMVALRGSLLLRQGRLAEAESDLQRAIRMNNRLEMAYLDLELLYRTTGDKEKNIDILTRYLKILHPESEIAKETNQQIQKLLNNRQ